MGKTTGKSKQEWNAAHYTQVKVSVSPDLAAAFKASCASVGVSMAKALASSMSDYSGYIERTKQNPGIYETRRQRRSTLKKLLESLELIKQAEEAYADNIPENFRGGARHEAAEQSIEALDEAIALLAQVY